MSNTVSAAVPNGDQPVIDLSLAGAATITVDKDFFNQLNATLFNAQKDCKTPSSSDQVCLRLCRFIMNDLVNYCYVLFLTE